MKIPSSAVIDFFSSSLITGHCFFAAAKLLFTAALQSACHYREAGNSG
jgi:hypothetical protein